MTDRYDLVVYGKPQPAGSKRHVGNGRIVDANPNAKSWMQEVAHEAARIRDGRRPLEGPLALEILFCVPRPRSHYGTGRNSGQLKDSAPDRPATRPDATKLTRAVEDALTGIFYRDDGQISEQHIRRMYSATPRALISVYRVPPRSDERAE